MASLIDELISTLEAECDIYRGLIPIAKEKTLVIVKNDLTALQAITDKEQTVVDQINVLEHKREVVVANIKTVIGWKSEALDLKTLIKLLEKQPKEQRTLSILHDNLQDVIQRLVEINKHNKSLIENSLEMIEFSMNFIQSTRIPPGNNTYTKNASQNDAQILRAGMFDAKQ